MNNKYNINSELFLIGKRFYRKAEPCTNCDADGRLSTTSGRIFACPECEGSGTVYKGYKRFEITNNFYEIVAILREDDEFLYTNYFNSEDGTDWEGEKDLFLTKKEAQAECDRRNNGI